MTYGDIAKRCRIPVYEGQRDTGNDRRIGTYGTIEVTQDMIDTDWHFSERLVWACGFGEWVPCVPGTYWIGEGLDGLTAPCEDRAMVVRSLEAQYRKMQRKGYVS